MYEICDLIRYMLCLIYVLGKALLYKDGKVQRALCARARATLARSQCTRPQANVCRKYLTRADLNVIKTYIGNLWGSLRLNKCSRKNERSARRCVRVGHSCEPGIAAPTL